MLATSSVSLAEWTVFNTAIISLYWNCFLLSFLFLLPRMLLLVSLLLLFARCPVLLAAVLRSNPSDDFDCEEEMGKGKREKEWDRMLSEREKGKSNHWITKGDLSDHWKEVKYRVSSQWPILFVQLWRGWSVNKCTDADSTTFNPFTRSHPHAGIDSPNCIASY